MEKDLKKDARLELIDMNNFYKLELIDFIMNKIHPDNVWLVREVITQFIDIETLEKFIQNIVCFIDTNGTAIKNDLIKVKDLFGKDTEFIKALYEEHYKDEKSWNHTAQTTLELFKKLLKHNDISYEVSLNENYCDYTTTNYFFFTKNNDYEPNKEIFLVKIDECSCGWDYSVEDNWKRFFDNVLEEDLIILVDKTFLLLTQKKGKE